MRVSDQDSVHDPGCKTEDNDLWIRAFQGGERSPGDFLNAGPISETVCLAAVALRAGEVKSGVQTYPSPIKVLYDSASMKITNLAEANK